LDSQALVWWFTNDERISARAARFIAEGDCLVSAVSAYEISSKVRLRKLQIAEELASRFKAICEEAGFAFLPVTVEHALAAASFASPHRDPFDRLLAAQAMIEDLTIVTSDAEVQRLAPLSVW
jgi:PIN domain nuclease of toxin-antitoxin system